MSDMARNRKTLTFTEQLRQAIRLAPMSQYRLAKEAGVPKETISRFLLGRVGMRLETVNAICEVLELRLVGSEEAPEETQGRQLSASKDATRRLRSRVGWRVPAE